MRKLNDYRQIKLNSVGYPIGLLPDDPNNRHLVSPGTNWELVPSTLVLEALTRALENDADQATASKKTMNTKQMPFDPLPASDLFDSNYPKLSCSLP